MGVKPSTHVTPPAPFCDHEGLQDWGWGLQGCQAPGSLQVAMIDPWMWETKALLGGGGDWLT